MTEETNRDYHPMWEKPKHHTEAKFKTNEVHWIELFYDLIHVVCIFLLGNALSHNLNVEGFLIFSSLFTVIWMSWGDYSYYNSLYISTDYKHRILSSLQIITIMIIAASIPSISSGGFTFFVGAYILNRIIMGLIYWRARRHNHTSGLFACEMSRNFFIISIIYFPILFLPFNIGIITLFLTVLITQLMYFLPQYGVMRLDEFTPRIHHISERLSLLLLICLGEGFFKMALELSEKGISTASWDILLNYSLGGISLFLLAWMYFDFAGKWVVKDAKKITMIRWWYSHMFLMLAAVMIGVALTGTVKIHYYDPYPIKYAIIGCIGLSLYILSLWSIESTLKRWSQGVISFTKVRILGIIIPILILGGIYLGLPSILGNAIFLLGITIQLLIPILLGYKMIFQKK